MPGSEADMQELARLRAKVRAELSACNASAFGPRLRRTFAGQAWYRRSSKGKGWQKAPVTRIALRGLDRAWANCTGYGDTVSALTLAERHALRKKLKSLRYLTEHFSDLWPGKRREAFLDHLKTLQDALGRINDIALLQMEVPADAITQHVHESETDKSLTIAEKAWRKLHKVGRYWD